MEFLKRHKVAVLIFLGVFAAYLVFSPFTMGGMGYSGEEMATADRLITRVDAWRHGLPIPKMRWARHSLLPILFDIPFVAAGKFIVSPDFMFSLEPVLVSAGLVTLLYLWLRKVTSPGMSLLLTLTGAFGTMLWPYAYIGLEPKQSFFVMLAGYLGLTRGRIRGWPMVLLLGTICGLAVSLKATGMVLGPAMAYLIYLQFRDDWRERKPELAALLGIAAVLFLFAAWGRAHFFTNFGSNSVALLRRLLTDSPLTFFTNWIGVFGERNKGAFIYAPVIMLAIFAFPRVWKTHRETAIFVLLLVVCVSGELAGLRAPADEVWGSRYMHTVLAPVLVVIGAARPRFEWKREAPLLVLASVGVVVSFLGSMFYYGQLHFATMKEGENTLEWLAGDSVWNPVQFHARLLGAWLKGGPEPVLWTPEHYWMYEPPPGAPPPKAIDLRAYCSPQPYLLRLWPVPKTGKAGWIFAVLLAIGLAGPALLGWAWRLSVVEGESAKAITESGAEESGAMKKGREKTPAAL